MLRSYPEPLTPSRTNMHITPHAAGVTVQKVDTSAPGIPPVLQPLAEPPSANLEPSDGGSSGEDEDSTPPELLVKILPPIYVCVLPPAPLPLLALVSWRVSWANVSSRCVRRSNNNPRRLLLLRSWLLRRLRKVLPHLHLLHRPWKMLIVS